MAGLPDPGMVIDREHTALVITDPQNDFLSPDGATWSIIGESVVENKTVEHLEHLLETAKQNDIPVFVSPHYYVVLSKYRWRHSTASLLEECDRFAELAHELLPDRGEREAGYGGFQSRVGGQFRHCNSWRFLGSDSERDGVSGRSLSGRNITIRTRSRLFWSQ